MIPYLETARIKAEGAGYAARRLKGNLRPGADSQRYGCAEKSTSLRSPSPCTWKETHRSGSARLFGFCTSMRSMTFSLRDSPASL